MLVTKIDVSPSQTPSVPARRSVPCRDRAGSGPEVPVEAGAHDVRVERNAVVEVRIGVVDPGEARPLEVSIEVLDLRRPVAAEHRLDAAADRDAELGPIDARGLELAGGVAERRLILHLGRSEAAGDIEHPAVP